MLGKRAIVELKVEEEEEGVPLKRHNAGPAPSPPPLPTIVPGVEAAPNPRLKEQQQRQGGLWMRCVVCGKGVGMGDVRSNGCGHTAHHHVCADKLAGSACPACNVGWQTTAVLQHGPGPDRAVCFMGCDQEFDREDTTQKHLCPNEMCCMCGRWLDIRNAVPHAAVNCHRIQRLDLAVRANIHAMCWAHRVGAHHEGLSSSYAVMELAAAKPHAPIRLWMMALRGVLRHKNAHPDGCSYHVPDLLDNAYSHVWTTGMMNDLLRVAHLRVVLRTRHCHTRCVKNYTPTARAALADLILARAMHGLCTSAELRGCLDILRCEAAPWTDAAVSARMTIATIKAHQGALNEAWMPGSRMDGNFGFLTPHAKDTVMYSVYFIALRMIIARHEGAREVIEHSRKRAACCSLPEYCALFDFAECSRLRRLNRWADILEIADAAMIPALAYRFPVPHARFRLLHAEAMHLVRSIPISLCIESAVGPTEWLMCPNASASIKIFEELKQLEQRYAR